MHTIPVSSAKPTAPGVYVFVGLYSRDPQLVTLYLRQPQSYGGLPAGEPYLAAADHSTAPERWAGQWSEALAFSFSP